jgi:hypothetical protein
LPQNPFFLWDYYITARAVWNVFGSIYLRRPDPPAKVARKHTIMAFQGLLATSSPYLHRGKVKHHLNPFFTWVFNGKYTCQIAGLHCKCTVPKI